MPRTLYDEEDNPVETLTEEELKTNAEKAAQYEKEKSDWEQEKARLEQEVNPNWKEMRRKEKEWQDREKKYQDDLAKAGVKSDTPAALTREDVDRIAEEKAKKVTLENHKASLLAQYDEKSRESVEHYFNKFAEGETLSVETIEKNMQAAERAAGVKPVSRPRNLSGQPPVFKNDTKVTDTQREMAANFGLTEKDLQEE